MSREGVKKKRKETSFFLVHLVCVVLVLVLLLVRVVLVLVLRVVLVLVSLPGVTAWTKVAQPDKTNSE